MINKKVFTWAGLVVYTIILSCFIILYRLPADRLVAAALNRYSNGRFLFSAEEMSYVFPLGYKMEKISYGIKLGINPLISDHINSLSISPDYGALLQGFLPLKVKGLISRGNVEAKVGISVMEGFKNGYIRINFNDILLHDLNIFKSYSSRTLKGKMNGDLNLVGNLMDPIRLKGNGQLILNKGSIGTTIDIPGLNEVPFSNLQMDFSTKNGTILLRNSRMDGPLFSGKFSGGIKLKKDVVKSQMNLRGEMNLGPSVEKNEFVGQFIERIRKQKGPLIIKIEGTLERPVIFWSKS